MIAISDVPSTQQEMILDFDKTEDPASPSLPPTPILSPKHPPRPYTYTPEALAWFNEIKWTEDGFERMEISAVIRLAAIGSEDGGRADRDKDERGEEGRTMMEFDLPLLLPQSEQGAPSFWLDDPMVHLHADLGLPSAVRRVLGVPERVEQGWVEECERINREVGLEV